MAQEHDHDHDGHDHAGHDHAGHDHSGHSHAGHSHGHGGHSHSHGSTSETRTAIAALITLAFMVVEVIGGVLSGSLALIADAAHMATDAVSLALAWWAFRQIRRPASARMSFGHHRMPVLVAFGNAVALILLTAWIAVEAIERFRNPVEIQWETMGGVALAGLLANIAAFLVLSTGEKNLNIRGALLHVASDMLGSVAAIAAALVIYFTGWTPIDPLLSLLVGFLLLRATLSLMKDSSHILLQGAPEGREGPAISDDLKTALPSVADVHHVHTWALSEERLHATLHVVPAADADGYETVRAVKARLKETFGITHTTVEIERAGDCADESNAAGDCGGAAAGAAKAASAHSDHDHEHDHDHAGHGHAAGHAHA